MLTTTTTIALAASDLHLTPPVVNKYDAIKNRIVNSFAETNESKLRGLLHGLEFIFDEKPTLLLQRIRNYATGQVNEQFLRIVLLERLAENVRGILAISDGMNLDKLAIQADKIIEATRADIAAISYEHAPQEIPVSSLTEMANAITTLSKQIEKFLTKERSQSRSKSRALIPTDSYNRGDQQLGFSHQRFGDQARKCQQPCSWPNQGN